MNYSVIDGLVCNSLQVLSRLTSPLPRVVSLRRGPGCRDGYATTQLNLGEIPLLSRRPSPAISAATDLEEHFHNAVEVRMGHYLQPHQQRVLVSDADYFPPPPSSRDTAVSACSTSSFCDDQLSPVDAAADAADDDDNDDDMPQ